MLKGELKVGDRLLYKPGTEDFRRCKVENIGASIVDMVDERNSFKFGRTIEDVMANCDHADLDTGIKPL
jgi:hypothetical protein